MPGRAVTAAASAAAAALAAGQTAATNEFRALTVAYLPARDALEVITVNNGGFVIPRHLVAALENTTPADLARLELWPDGSLIEIEHKDIHIAVDGMIKSALQTLVPGRIVAGLFAAAGGAAKSLAKAESARRNGQRGGRPKAERAAS